VAMPVALEVEARGPRKFMRLQQRTAGRLQRRIARFAVAAEPEMDFAWRQVKGGVGW